MEQTQNFTKGKILGPLLKFSMPVLLALFLQAMYGAVDLLIVGWFGTAADVSAVSTGSQIMMSITSIFTGLAMGTTILLGQKIGQNKSEQAGDIIGSSIALFAALALVVTGLVVAFAGPIATVMQAPVESFDKAVWYIKICGGGGLFIVAYNLLGSIFRGIGNSKTPLLAVFIACIANILGDLLFVAVFHMAAAGAALATVLSQALSVGLCFIAIKKQGLPFAFSQKNVRANKPVIGKIIRLGIPIAFQSVLVSISFLAIVAIVNGLGVIPSAGVGVAEKLCSFIMLVPSAYMQSMSVFVAQNIGANRNDRAKKAMAYGMATSLAFGCVMGYFAFFHGDMMAAIFTQDRAVIGAAADYLRAYAIDTLLVSFLFCFCGYFNGCGKTTFVMTQGIIGAFLVRIPVSYLMSQLPEVTLFKVGLATPISTVLQISLCLIYFIWMNKNAKITLLN